MHRQVAEAPAHQLGLAGDALEDEPGAQLDAGEQG
jgi:hypothetical protein